jgi:hypothetical protein
MGKWQKHLPSMHKALDVIPSPTKRKEPNKTNKQKGKPKKTLNYENSF